MVNSPFLLTSSEAERYPWTGACYSSSPRLFPVTPPTLIYSCLFFPVPVIFVFYRPMCLSGSLLSPPSISINSFRVCLIRTRFLLMSHESLQPHSYLPTSSFSLSLPFLSKLSFSVHLPGLPSYPDHFTFLKSVLYQFILVLFHLLFCPIIFSFFRFY